MKKIKIIYGLEAVGGGALKHLTYLITRLNKELFDITIVLSNQRDDNSKSDINKILASGASVIFLSIHRKIHIIKDFIAFVHIFNILRTGNYNIIHAHSSKAGGLFRIAAFALGKSSVLYTPHCFYFQGKNGFRKYIFLYIEKLFAKITTSIIVSEGEMKHVLKYQLIQKERIMNINNAIDFSDYPKIKNIQETLKKFSIPEGKIIVGAVGRLTLQKDWKTFILAADEVLKKYPETIFVITGEGELENEIQKLISNLGLEKNIIMTGYVSEIYKIFGIIDIFVSTSLWEGLPYVMLEAMKFKKPIIATNIGNEGIIANGRSGFITPVRDYYAIAIKISVLIADKKKIIQMGKEGNDILLQKYSFELFIRKHETLYTRLNY